MNTNLPRLQFVAVLLLFVAGIWLGVCAANQFRSMWMDEVAMPASASPLADASLFHGNAAQFEPALAPYCVIPDHSATVDVDHARSFVLSFHTPCPSYVSPSILFRILPFSLVPDCWLVRHHVMLVPASQQTKADIVYLPLRMGGKPVLIAMDGGGDRLDLGKTVFTFPSDAGAPRNEAGARKEVAAILGQYFLWSPKPELLSARRTARGFECVPQPQSLPGNIFNKLRAETLPGYVVLRLEDAWPGHDFIAAQPRRQDQWIASMRDYDEYIRATAPQQFEKDWQECGCSTTGEN